MRITFDSEEQKKAFKRMILDDITREYCPSSLSLHENYAGCMGNTGKCEECWRESGLEMEVKDNE